MSVVLVLSSYLFKVTNLGNRGTKVGIASAPGLGQDQDRMGWNALGKGNWMVYGSKGTNACSTL